MSATAPLTEAETHVIDTLADAVREASACRLCEAVLPLGVRPVFRVSSTARVVIVSQAPSTKVHLTGLPWNDASGDRLAGSASTMRRGLPLCHPGCVIPDDHQTVETRRHDRNVRRCGWTGFLD